MWLNMLSDTNQSCKISLMPTELRRRSGGGGKAGGGLIGVLMLTRSRDLMIYDVFAIK